MSNELWEMLNEIVEITDKTRLQFLRKVLPLTQNDDELLEFARALAAAIGEISFNEAITAFNKELEKRRNES